MNHLNPEKTLNQVNLMEARWTLSNPEENKEGHRGLSNLNKHLGAKKKKQKHRTAAY